MLVKKEVVKELEVAEKRGMMKVVKWVEEHKFPRDPVIFQFEWRDFKKKNGLKG